MDKGPSKNNGVRNSALKRASKYEEFDENPARPEWRRARFLLGGDGGEQHMKDVLWPEPDPLHADSLESAAEKQSVNVIVHMCKCGI